MASKKKIPAAAGPDHPANPAAPVVPPLDAITKLELFLEKNWKGVVAFLVIVVAAVTVYFYMKTKREDSMTAANNAVTAAETRPDLQAVLNDHPGTVAAGTAMYQIADRQFKSSEPAAARKTLENFVTDFPDHPLRENALLGLGTMTESAGEYDKAGGYFKQVADGGGELAGLANLCQAELLVAKGELEKAKEAYDSFGPNNSGSPFVETAVERAEALEQRIARKNAPTPPVEPEPEKPKPVVDPNAPLGPRVTPTPGAPNEGAAPVEESSTPAPDPEGGAEDGAAPGPESEVEEPGGETSPEPTGDAAPTETLETEPAE